MKEPPSCMESEVKAPAKVNLSLLVGSVGVDGYHEVFSVFVPVDVFDKLVFDLAARPSGEGPGNLQVECETAPGENNLVARALRSLERATGWAIEGWVGITKAIPSGAGLGGGSSDAAAALRAGAEAIVVAGGRRPGEDLLRALARSVGADVPFFLQPEASFARGVGNVLEPVRLPSMPLVLVFNEAQLSTKAVYSEFDRIVSQQAGSAGDASSYAGVEATGGGGPSAPEGGGMEFGGRVSAHEAAWRALSHEWMDGQLNLDQVAAQAAGLLANDLQRASFGLLPSLVDDLRAILEEGALGAAMSGSGPTLFGLAATASAADTLAEKLAARGLRVRRATAA
jgi:4-diphosphocytidyl-2C-methyl-D-erythritol kinase